MTRRALFYRHNKVERLLRVVHRFMRQRTPRVLGLYETISPIRLVPQTEMFGESLISATDLASLVEIAERALAVEGIFIELGVYQGGSLVVLAELLCRRSPERTLFGLDTFTGQPDDSTAADVCADGTPFYSGVFSDTDFNRVRNQLGQRGVSRVVRLVPGPFAATLPTLGEPKVAFAHVDCDTHFNVQTCIRWLRPRMSQGGIIYFDDYLSPLCPGAKVAIEEAFGDAVQRCGTTQGYWVAPNDAVHKKASKDGLRNARRSDSMSMLDSASIKERTRAAGFGMEKEPEAICNLGRIQTLQLDLTNRCNLACGWCVAGTGRLESQADLPLAKVESFLAASLADLGAHPREIFLSCNGESTLYPDLIGVLRYLETQHQGLTIGLDTNGVRMPVEVLEALATFCRNRYLVSVSVWGHDESSYQRFHGNARAFAKVQRTIPQLLHHQTDHFRVCFSTIAHDWRENRETVRRFLLPLAASAGQGLRLRSAVQRMPYDRMFARGAPLYCTVKPFFDAEDRTLVAGNFRYYQHRLSRLVHHRSCYWARHLLLFHHTGIVSQCLFSPASKPVLDTRDVELTAANLVAGIASSRATDVAPQVPTVHCSECALNNMGLPRPTYAQVGLQIGALAGMGAALRDLWRRLP